jgi:hypothetical protein
MVYMKNKVKKIEEKTIEVNGEIYTKQDSSGWLKIQELGIEVEIQVHDKDRSWDDLNLKEREKELLTVEQCIFLANSKYAKELKMDGSSSNDDFFIQQPFNLSRKNGYVARFVASSYCADLGCFRDSVGSCSSLGVRFVRPFKK